MDAEISDVAEHDCAQCGAKLGESADWCSLCYAPVAVPVRIAAHPSLYSGQHSGQHSGHVVADEGTVQTEALATRDVTGDSDQLGFDFGDAGFLEPDFESDDGEWGEGQRSERPSGTWPCLGCGSSNSMGEDVCLACGLPFLAHAKTPPVLQVPGLGDIFQRSRTQQVTFIAATGFVLLGVILGLMALFGLVI